MVREPHHERVVQVGKIKYFNRSPWAQSKGSCWVFAQSEATRNFRFLAFAWDDNLMSGVSPHRLKGWGVVQDYYWYRRNSGLGCDNVLVFGAVPDLFHLLFGERPGCPCCGSFSGGSDRPLW